MTLQGFRGRGTRFRMYEEAPGFLPGPRYVAWIIYPALSTGTKVCAKHRREAQAPAQWTGRWRWGPIFKHFTTLCVLGFNMIAIVGLTFAAKIH